MPRHPAVAVCSGNAQWLATWTRPWCALCRCCAHATRGSLMDPAATGCQPRLTACILSAWTDKVQELSGLSDAADSRDPAVGLAAVAALRDLVEELEELHVDNARSLGWS